MNKKFVNAALVSLLFCAVHNSNGMEGANSGLSELNDQNLGGSLELTANFSGTQVQFKGQGNSVELNTDEIVDRKERISKKISRESARYSQNLKVAAGIKTATHIAKKSILKDHPAIGSTLDEAANINGLVRVFSPNEKSRKYHAENAGSYITSVAVAATSNILSKTSIGKKVEELFNGRLNPIKIPCKYLVETFLARLLWTSVSNRI